MKEHKKNEHMGEQTQILRHFEKREKNVKIENNVK